MCGRYRLTAKERYLRDHFGLDVGVKWLPRWNIAPTQMIPTIRQHPKEPVRIFSLMRWGLIPYWAKDASIGLKTINAASETAAAKLRGLVGSLASTRQHNPRNVRDPDDTAEFSGGRSPRPDAGHSERR